MVRFVWKDPRGYVITGDNDKYQMTVKEHEIKLDIKDTDGKWFFMEMEGWPKTVLYARPLSKEGNFEPNFLYNKSTKPNVKVNDRLYQTK